MHKTCRKGPIVIIQRLVDDARAIKKAVCKVFRRKIAASCPVVSKGKPCRGRQQCPLHPRRDGVAPASFYADGTPERPSRHDRVLVVGVADHGAKRHTAPRELPGNVREETIALRLVYLVTLADSGLHTRAIEHRDSASPVAD